MRPSVFATLLVVAALCLVAACDGNDHQEGSNLTQDQDSKGGHESGGHGHQAPHGGIVNSIGEHHLELVHDGMNGNLTLYVLDSDEAPMPIVVTPMKAYVRLEDVRNLVEVELRAIGLEADAKGRSSQFVGAHYQLKGSKTFDVIVRVPIGGKVFRTRFQVTPEDLSTVYVCPMACEKDKVHYEPGQCPVCEMDLVEPSQAHADHSPKHGGVFFMAPNKWHHLEGVVPSASELRIYLDNNFTKPISAKAYVEGTYADVVGLNQQKEAMGDPVRLTFRLAPDGSYLTTSIPKEVRFPLSVTAWIKFDRTRADLFNFTFEHVSDFK